MAVGWYGLDVRFFNINIPISHHSNRGVIEPPSEKAKKYGVKLLNINTNGRLIGIGWTNGLILVYDIEEFDRAHPPMLMAVTKECLNQNIM